MSAKNFHPLVGATTRYIAGRNAMQTVYWRSSGGPNGRMVKTHKHCGFDRTQDLPLKIRMQYYNKNYMATEREAQ